MVGWTVRHYADLGTDRTAVSGDVLDAAGWDALRVQTTGVYSLPATRAELEAKAAGVPEITERARLGNDVLDQRGVRTVVSYGVGAALIEVLMLKQRPGRPLALTEYAPATVRRLRDILPDVSEHDLLHDPPPRADLHLFHRLDSSLSNREWRHVFGIFRTERILFVSSGVLAPKDAWELFRKQSEMRSRSAVDAGWVRTRPAYERLWRTTHRHERLRLGDVDGWWLAPRSRRGRRLDVLERA